MKAEYTEYELIVLVREQKDEDALKILLKKYSPIIGKIASTYYGVGYDYQDFFQEGRIAFVRAIETFDENANSTFYAYSMTCVRNALISIYRKLKRNTGLDQLIDDMEEINKIGVAVNSNYVKQMDKFLNEKMIIEEALVSKELLSNLEKQCLKYFLLDNDYKEVATILGVSPKKVDNALSRCKSKLRKLNY